MIPRLLSQSASLKVGWPVRKPQKYIRKWNHTTFCFTSLPRSCPWIDFHQIWSIGCLADEITCTSFSAIRLNLCVDSFPLKRCSVLRRGRGGGAGFSSRRRWRRTSRRRSAAGWWRPAWRWCAASATPTRSSAWTRPACSSSPPSTCWGCTRRRRAASTPAASCRSSTSSPSCRTTSACASPTTRILAAPSSRSECSEYSGQWSLVRLSVCHCCTWTIVVVVVVVAYRVAYSS